ncbi:hypothetical protein C5167_001522 [Papaver somniferum]|uniref:Uncharacterized protein n=1 Tax=Papaver somniferum TaxID=3469 RepID=A0A4Y7KWW5_PAPSO|nr:uncharacterized protein LOC113308519 [Papaver somniferum]RZC77386.1 hypothetical protein C5167_001522 [Papaver somniferum]
MGEEDRGSYGGAYAAPPLVSLSSFFSPSSTSYSSRRLSSNFSEPNRPIRSARRLSWVNLQGRLVNAEESSSSKAIGGSLSKEEGLAWDLFSPIRRILIVAVVAVASADLKKSRQIWKLKKAIYKRDQVLLSMQEKLDNLCEQVTTTKDQGDIEEDVSFTKIEEIPFNKVIKLEQSIIPACGCRPCGHHQDFSNGLTKDFGEKPIGGDEMFKFKPVIGGAEQEERRMSDLSDWGSSVTSAADIQLSSLALEQDIYNLQRECEEKDTTIKELASIVNAVDATGSKRISELEDVIRRKNLTISKLKKDMAVLEQQVVHLTRLRRPSSSALTLKVSQLPVMADNLLYDMSSSSPSSSDSDTPVENPPRPSVSQERSEITPPICRNVLVQTDTQTPSSAKPYLSLTKSTNKSPKLQSVSPLTENSMNQRSDSKLLVSNEMRTSGDQKRNRRRFQQPGSAKRWV